ncbi:12-(S)-hydroxy-5,8,10,14-eicosatetraenoic acid receptor [Esox lucius]|uniref:G-protein coupled receptors family 1 profile domain-containing protein n=1 Tax=Esox lucius TaxID=8010 RepID=A0AAY5KXG1_ESOLU|nr:12-(S)-hydroxy-5,8,10,14-eicosatetraenoic acid receptor [Esox lucius]
MRQLLMMDNNTEDDVLSDNCTAVNPAVYTMYASVMIIEFILAVPLNLSVLYLFIFKLQFWKPNSNNLFLFNLVLADLLLLVCLPVNAYNYIWGERYSSEKLVCKTMFFMLFLNRGASIAFLTVIAVDRYFNVVHPGKKNVVIRRSPQISVLIWVVLLPLTLPTMLKTDCCNSHGDATDILREIVFFTQILIPFFVLVYCTVPIVNRLKKQTIGDTTKLRRAVFLVTLVMLVFSFCFLPCTLARMVLLIVRKLNQENAKDIWVQVYDGLIVLSYMDCLIDPYVYCLSSSKFKSLYLSTFCPCLAGTDEETTDNTNSTDNPGNAKRKNNPMYYSR